MVSFTVSGHGCKCDVTVLCVEGEQLQLQLTGGGEALTGAHHHPTVGGHTGKRPSLSAPTVRGTEGAKKV